ncbi:DNA transformation protein [Variovorax paradoxus]|uniref:TfoX/Sxy family protein n=1 Tax=Variovorax paradoxus TaxID=34073 RepID=UPI00278E1FF8|nr:TfoX/Sxy family protein [Variovorax paradoxus]MDQ0572355.1 DNA transformation protein [Variovorax paradoxus]
MWRGFAGVGDTALFTSGAWRQHIMSEASPQFIDFIVDRLSGIPRIAKTRFFGGTGLSADATQFAMIMGSTVYFVVNNNTRPKYEKLGSHCFAYNTKARRVQVRKYFEVPIEVIEDHEALVELAREAVRVAKSLATKKPAGKRA